MVDRPSHHSSPVWEAAELGYYHEPAVKSRRSFTLEAPSDAKCNARSIWNGHP